MKKTMTTAARPLFEQLRDEARNSDNCRVTRELFRQAADELDAERWIPITLDGELPTNNDEDDPVWFWKASGEICYGPYMASGRFFWNRIKRDHDGESELVSLEEVTHWRRVREPW